MKRYAFLLSVAVLPFVIGCGGGDSSTPAATTSSTATISGTVPGTLIEAFCEDGSYFRVTSTDNGTSEHPFSLSIPQGTNCRIVMTTNENDPANMVVTPICYVSGSATGSTIVLHDDVDVGHVPLSLDPNGIADANEDHVSDNPLCVTVDAAKAAVSTAAVLDTDGDGIVDPYEDDDGDRVVNAYEDDDHDGTLNMYDDDDGDTHPDYMEDDDHDGTPNYRDDDNGDHTPDYIENENSNEESNNDSTYENQNENNEQNYESDLDGNSDTNTDGDGNND